MDATCCSRMGGRPHLGRCTTPLQAGQFKTCLSVRAVPSQDSRAKFCYGLGRLIYNSGTILKRSNQHCNRCLSAARTSRWNHVLSIS